MAGLVDKMVVGGSIHSKTEASLTLTEDAPAEDISATYTEAEVQAIADALTEVQTNFNALVAILEANGILLPSA